MSVDSKTVDRIAELARLSFDEEEKKEIQKDMNRMLEFVDKIQEVDTEGVEPLVYMLEEETPLRRDQEHTQISKADALQNAPDKDSDYIRVPKVLSK